jgi:hypothetical protein
MSAALNSVKTFRVKMRTFGDKNLLKLVYFIVKSSCHNSQIKYFLKSAAPEWAPHLKL